MQSHNVDVESIRFSNFTFKYNDHLQLEFLYWHISTHQWVSQPFKANEKKTNVHTVLSLTTKDSHFSHRMTNVHTMLSLTTQDTLFLSNDKNYNSITHLYSVHYIYHVRRFMWAYSSVQSHTKWTKKINHYLIQILLLVVRNCEWEVPEILKLPLKHPKNTP